MTQPHISLAAEKIGIFGGWPITNSILMTWVVMGILLVLAIVVNKQISMMPKTMQTIVEMLIEGLHALFKSVVGEYNVDAFFPLLATIFIFVAMANWSGLLPGVGTVGLEREEIIHEVEKMAKPVPEIPKVDEQTQVKIPESPEVKKAVETKTSSETKHIKFIPLLRGPTADLNTTLALALISFFSMHYFGFAHLGVVYIQKYINFSNPIMFFVGLLEIISDLSKIMSFTFRLFGNIFAGEVLLTVIAFLMPIFAPLPFLGLELFVGFIQALVFSMLTAVFLNMSVAKHEAH